MKEFDLRKEANKNMEYITPKKIREWLANKIHSKYAFLESVFDPAVGSGQLFQFVKSKIYIGSDINEKALLYFENNFKNAIIYKGNYFEIKQIKKYDIAISNYPFSLNCKDLFCEPPINLEQFFSKNITGKADFPFIIKSFLESRKGGFYLCFPGISYRTQEQKFRDFLINNNYVESFGTLKNCEFDATNIDVFYLELSKNKTNDKVEKFIFDFKEEKNNKIEIVDRIELLGETWRSPEILQEQKLVDINAIELEIKNLKIKRRETEDELDNFIYKTFK